MGTGTSLRPCSDIFQQSSPNSGWCFYSSSAECWISPLCYRDRYAQCQTVRCRQRCSTLIRWSTFVVQVQQVRVQAVRRQSRSHSRSPFLGPGRSHARCVQRQMPMVDVLMQFIDISHVPVIMQRRCIGKVPQIQLSPVTVDIPVVQQRRGIFSSADDGGDKGLLTHLLTHFASFFALLPLSRS